MAGNENDDKWYFTRKEIEENSPSRRDGVSLQKENQLRKKYSRFISETCQKFQIPKVVLATANLYCHRFFLQRSLAKHTWYRIAIACLFLASKVEDHRIRMDTFKEEGWRETFMEVFKKEIPFKAHKKMIIEDERAILEAINFEITVDHPHMYFVKAVRKIKEVPAEVCRAATEFMDNSYFLSVSLQFKPQKIAGAAFHLSYKFLKLKLPFQEEEGYREFFQMTPNELEDISSQMMDLYEYRPPPNTAPDNQSASSSSSSSLPGHQSLSALTSTSAAAHGNQSTSSPSSSSLPGHQSLSALTSTSAAAHGNQSASSSSPSSLPGHQSLSALTSTSAAAHGNQSASSSSSSTSAAAHGNQSSSSSSSSSLPGHQSRSAVTSTSAAAYGNQSPPPQAWLRKKFATVLIPHPPAPGKESYTELMPPPPAISKRSQPESSHPPAAPKTKARLYYRRKPLQPVVPGDQSPPQPAALSIQIPPPSFVTLPYPAAPSHQNLSQPAADPKKNSPASSRSSAAPGSQNPPVPLSPVELGNQSPTVRAPLPAASGNKSPPVTGILRYYRRKPRQPAAPRNQNPPPSVPQATSSPPAAHAKQSPSGPPQSPTSLRNQSTLVQPLPPAAPSNQSSPPPVAPCKKSPTAPPQEPAVPGNQSPPLAAAASEQNPSTPTALGKQSPTRIAAPGSSSPSPPAPDNQSRSAE